MNWLLLAQAETPNARIEAMRKYIEGRGHDSSLWWGLLGVLAGGALFFFGLHYLNQFQQFRPKRGHRNAHRLFRDCMHALHLPISDRVLLHRLARALQLENPTLILVSPTTLQWATDEWRRLPAPGLRPKGRELNQLTEIAVRAFGQKADNDDEHASPPPCGTDDQAKGPGPAESGA